MKKQIRSSLEKITKQHQEILESLNKEEIVKDIQKYTTLNKKLNSIEKIVQNFQKFQNNEKNIFESKELIKQETDEELVKLAKSEIEQAEKENLELEKELEILLLPKDENDEKNVIVEIRGAAGGDEANIFAGNLFDMYKAWSVTNKMQIQPLNSSRSDSGGFSLVVFKVIGTNVYSKLKFESGVHRVQRVPSTETQGRVHTSTATVTVIPEADETIKIDLKPADLKIDTYRSSGAGGQSVNTTDSAVRITHLPTGIVASSQDGKSQISNKELALQVLKSRIYEKQLREEREKTGAFRKLAGSGDRSEKIRTYNYPQDRVTDHRIGFSTSLKNFVAGNINPVINALLAEEQAEKIKNANEKTSN